VSSLRGKRIDTHSPQLVGLGNSFLLVQSLSFVDEGMGKRRLHITLSIEPVNSNSLKRDEKKHYSHQIAYFIACANSIGSFLQGLNIIFLIAQLCQQTGNLFFFLGNRRICCLRKFLIELGTKFVDNTGRVAFSVISLLFNSLYCKSMISLLVRNAVFVLCNDGSSSGLATLRIFLDFLDLSK
jgi:hypothetical protein